MNQPLRLILVEIDSAFAASLIAALKSSGIDAKYETTADAITFGEALNSGIWDVILFGKGAPGFDVFTALAQLKGAGYSIPLLFICSSEEEEGAIRAMQMGARDYIVKEDLKRLSPVIRRELSNVRLKEDREVVLEALAVSEKRYDDLINASPDVIYVLTPKGTVASLSPVFEKLTGWSLDEVIGESISTLLHPDDFALIAERFRREMSGEMVETQRARIKTKSGGYIIAEFKSTPIVERGEIVGVRGTARDVTESIQAEESLKESEKKYRDLTESSLSGIYIYQDTVLKFVNQKFCDISGYEREEALGMPFWMFVHPDQREYIKERGFARERGEDERQHYELKAVNKKNETLWLDLRVATIQYEDRPAVMGNLIEITDRKQAEEALRETSDYLEKLLSYANAPIIVWDPGFKIHRFNHAFEHLTGYKADGVIGKELHTLFPKSSKKESLNKIARASKGERWESVEIPILRADGKTRLALWNSANIFAEDGKTIVATIAQGQDITDRKQAEEALRTSEERYRGLVESNPSAIAIHSVEGIILYVNESCLKIMGVTTDEIIGKSIFDFVNPDFRENISNRIKEIQNGRVISEAIAEKFIRLDGTTIDVEIVGTPITYKETAAIQVTFWDVTERKRIEEQLAESEERYRTLQSNIPVGIFRSDPELDGKIISANPALAEMFGYESVDEILDVRVADFYTNPEDRAEFAETMNEVGVVTNYEVEMRQRSGGVFWGSISARAVKGPDGEVTNFDGVLKDIGERKEFEIALAASEKTYRSLYESNQVLADVTDLETVIEVITRTARDLLGATDSTLFRVNKTEKLLEPIYYYPDAYYEEVMKLRLKIGEGLSGKVAETGKAGFINYDEEDSISVHIPGTDIVEDDIESIMAVPMFEDDGSVLGVISIGLIGAKFVEDDLKKLNFFARQAEIAIKRARFYKLLKESEDKYRGVVDKSFVGLYITQKNKLKFANIRFIEMFGFHDPEEIIDKDTMKFIAPDSREIVTEQVRLRESGDKQVARYEFKALKRDGTIFEVEALGSRIIYDGSPAIQGSLIDITERKRAEETLKRDRQAFALIAEAATEAEDTSDISQRILDGLAKIIGFEMGSVHLLEATSGLLSPLAITGFYDKPIEEAVEAIHIGNDNHYIAALVARTKKPIFAPDLEAHRIFETHKERINALGIRSMISWPLLNIDKSVLGVIQLASSEVKTLSESDRLFFGSIMSTFGTALAKKRTDEEMIELRRAKDTLTDLVVHDIKNISSTMYSWLEMISEEVLGALTEEQADAVKRIAKQNEGLFQLSEEMLDIARAEEGDINLNKITYALDNQVLDVIEYYLPTTEKENKVIQPSFEDEAIIVNADESRVRRVIANLIQNAVRFAPPDAGRISVSLQKGSNAKTAVFKVTDNGPGIPDEFQTLIFEKYSQAELKSQGFKKGHGLGLTYCKMIVEAHGGIINVESDGKSGSTFSFTLPINET